MYKKKSKFKNKNQIYIITFGIQYENCIHMSTNKQRISSVVLKLVFELLEKLEISLFVQ